MKSINLTKSRHSMSLLSLWRQPARQTSTRHLFTTSKTSDSLPATTDLSPLNGRCVLAIVDEDNLRISMQHHDRPLSYRWLLERLQQEAKTILPIAVLTAPEGEQRRELYLKARGWRVLSIPRETVLTCTGPKVKANADADIAFELGNLMSTENFDTVLLGTGDGDLAVAIGRGVLRKRSDVILFTLAVPGSASSRLHSRTDLFAGHVTVGRDLCRDRDCRTESGNQ